ncbi:hypothetical protein EPA93_43265 [Ktedonosporobacter rubrisoli]|uniref:Uncharacterized protein n=1 Tax=Ktedonosporobacter rubrisoli TaxID=2509675 RepID=A0A4P6K4H9_KTERU|nr:hypothetical protein [Ktedonosporobacter rubrisoli]QBD82436.1 hypothetical protein EPA93_43265 [Ktedonosporobacter rubrisoli]
MLTYRPLPVRTVSPVARRLHALLRYCPGYSEAYDSPSTRRAQWVLDALEQLNRSDLPLGCRDAVYELQQCHLPASLTRYLSVDQLCKIIVELGRYCAYRNVAEEEFAREQTRGRSRSRVR